MSQTTEIQIQNQAGLPFRQKMNLMLSALNTCFAGTAEPTVTEAYMNWLDTSVTPNVLKRRNAGDTAFETHPLQSLADATKITADAAMPKTGGNFTGAANANKGADIASSATTNIGAATGEYVRVTGATTITALGIAQAGTQREVTFASALTLTHNAASLILPTSADITTSAGDCATFRSEGAGNWRCVKYQKADGTPLVAAVFASAAENAAGTVENKAVDPRGIREAFNAAGSAPVYACRAWVNFNGTGTVAIQASGNVSSITDNGTGDYSVNFTTALPDEKFSIGGGFSNASRGLRFSPAAGVAPLTASSARIQSVNNSNTTEDASSASFQAFR